MELLAWWTFALVVAGAYVWARRRAAAGSPPRPPAGLDPLELRANVTIGHWGTSPPYSARLRVDDRHLVLELGRQRVVLAKDQVFALVDGGIFGWRVEHVGADRRGFGARRRDRARLDEALRRHGWPVRQE